MTAATIDVEAAYRKLRGPLLDLVYRTTGTSCDAEDIVQDVFTYTWSIRDRFVEDDEHPAAPLLWTLTRRQVQSAYHGRREHAASDWMGRQEWSAPVEADSLSPANRARLRKVTAALGKIGDDRRNALVLRYAHGMQWAAIGDELGTGESNATAIGRNALAQVRELVAERAVETRDDLVAAVLRGGLLDKLPPRRAAVARLRFLERLGYEEIAARLHIGAGTVQDHVKRINKLIRAHHRDAEAGCPVLTTAAVDADQLELLTARQRQAVLLRFRDGLAASEAGQRMGIGSHAVTRLCADARRRLAGAAVAA